MISFKQDFCGLRMVIAPLSSAIVESYFLFSSKPARAKQRQVRSFPREFHWDNAHQNNINDNSPILDLTP